MAYVTMKDLSETIDIHALEDSAHALWDKTQRKRRKVEQWLIKLLPYGLVLMVLIFYGLSAPHTAKLMSLITPTFVGQYFAPLGWELGVLIISALREAGWKTASTRIILNLLLVLSVVINCAGAFIAVVTEGSTAGLGSDTIAQLLGRFGTLPAQYQVVLFLLWPIGAVIPIIAKLSGEVVVKMALGHLRLEQETDDERWTKEVAKIMHGALLQEAMRLGAGAKTAGNWALAVVDQMYRTDVSEAVVIEARSKARLDPRGNEMGFAAIQARKGMGQTGTGQGQFLSAESFENQDVPVTLNLNDNNLSLGQDSLRIKRTDVMTWLRDNQTTVSHLNDRETCRLYMQDRFGVDTDSGYKTINRARKGMGQ